MNFCSACGTTLTAHARFCSCCGSAAAQVLDREALQVLDDEEGLEPAPTFKVFTTRFLAVLALVGLIAIGGGVAFARSDAGSGDSDGYYDRSALETACADSFAGLNTTRLKTDYYPAFVACPNLDEWLAAHTSSGAAAEAGSVLTLSCMWADVPTQVRMSQVCIDARQRASQRSR